MKKMYQTPEVETAVLNTSASILTGSTTVVNVPEHGMVGEAPARGGKVIGKI